MLKVDRYVPRKRNSQRSSLLSKLVTFLLLVVALQAFVRIFLFFPVTFTESGFEPEIDVNATVFIILPWLKEPIPGDILYIHLPNSSYETFCRITGPGQSEETWNCQGGQSGFQSDVDGPVTKKQVIGTIWFSL